MKGLFLLTASPSSIAPTSAGRDKRPLHRPPCFCAKAEGAEFVTVAKVEETGGHGPEERRSSAELGIEKGGLDQLVVACYDLLGLISYLTAGPKEVRAWTIEKGTKAPQAAGKITRTSSAASSAPRWWF